VRWAIKVWVWIVLLAAALIAEVFAGPLWAALILALKFGGSDLALGIWLRHRGAPALGYFAWAQAFLKIAVAGFVLAIVITALEPLAGIVFDPERFIWAFVLLFSGAFLGSVTTFAGAGSIAEDTNRLWLDKSAYVDLLANRWPLSCSGKRNRVPRLLILGLVEIMAITVLLLAGLAIHAWRMGAWGQALFLALIVIAVGVKGVFMFALGLREVNARELAYLRPEGPTGR
jgi:hypothetical protein